jgi:hypothetical protein
MATKLNQIIAVRDGKKTKVQKAITEVYHIVQKPTLFEGISRNYHPDTEDGETFPPENKQVQYTVKRAIGDVRESLSELFDITATQDYANCKATGDVVVNGETVLPFVPVTHLLFLEKQLVDVQSFVTKLPTLDPAERWSFSDVSDSYESESHNTAKTKKILRNHVQAEATKEHPAQVDVYSEDVKTGEWSTVKFSGAMPLAEKNAILHRIAELIDAVKCAREQANNTEIEKVSVADSIFGYIFK